MQVTTGLFWKPLEVAQIYICLSAVDVQLFQKLQHNENSRKMAMAHFVYTSTTLGFKPSAGSGAWSESWIRTVCILAIEKQFEVNLHMDTFWLWYSLHVDVIIIAFF